MKPKNFFTLTITLITCFSSVLAQQDVLFQIKFIPNKTYSTEMLNDMKMEMDFTGNKEKRAEMIKNGMKLPIDMNILQEMEILTKTGQLTSDKRIPLTISYNKMDVTMNVGGQEVKQPNPLKDFRMTGYATEDGKIRVDSIQGYQSAVKKEDMEKMVAQMLSAITFPEKPMKIGDSFTQEVPMVMPIAGNTMNMLTKMVYTLKELKDQKAFFDYSLTLSLDMKVAQVNSTATGSGSGKLVYDIPTNYVTETVGDMIMDMNMGIGTELMRVTARAKTSVKAKIL